MTAQRYRLRLPQRRAADRAAGPLPARLPRHRPHLALPAAPPGRSRVPRRRPLPCAATPRPRCRPTAVTTPGRWPSMPVPCTRPWGVATTPSSSATTGGRSPPTAPPPTNRRGGAGWSRRPWPPSRPWPTASSASTSSTAAGTCSSSRPPWPSTPWPWTTTPSSTACGRSGPPASTARGTRPGCGRSLASPENLSAAIGYYRATFAGPPDDAEAAAAQAAAGTMTPQPTLYLHGADDGCMGIDAIGPVTDFLSPGVGDGGGRRGRALPARGTSRRGQRPHRPLPHRS